MIIQGKTACIERPPGTFSGQVTSSLIKQQNARKRCFTNVSGVLIYFSILCEIRLNSIEV